MIQVVTPSNLFTNGNEADALRCSHLIARVQDGFRPSVLNVDFSLNHGDARAFGAGVHGKDGAGDGYRAIRSANVEVPGVTFRSLHDDDSLVEMDGGVATGRADRQLGALIHLHLGAVEEPHLGVGVGGSADEFTLADFVTQF